MPVRLDPPACRYLPRSRSGRGDLHAGARLGSATFFGRLVDFESMIIYHEYRFVRVETIVSLQPCYARV